MSEHTPGPWTVTRDGEGRRYAWIDGGAGFDAVARVTHAQDDISGYIPDTDRIEADSRAIANASLISAAPDLLAACEAAVTWWSLDNHDLASIMIDGLQAAIAKAKGQ